MTYVWIFGTSYLAALAFVLTLHKNKTDLAASRLQENGVRPEKIREFHKDVSRRSALLLARAVLIIGTITGLIVSTAYNVSV